MYQETEDTERNKNKGTFGTEDYNGQFITKQDKSQKYVKNTYKSSLIRKIAYKIFRWKKKKEDENGSSQYIE